jgi:AP endonuclease 1
MSSSSELSDADAPPVVAKKVAKKSAAKNGETTSKAKAVLIEKQEIKVDGETTTSKRVRKEVIYEETEEEEKVGKPKKGKSVRANVPKDDAEEPAKKKPRTNTSKTSKDDGDAESKPKKSRISPVDPFSASTISTHPPRLGPTSSTFLTPAGRPTHLVGAHTSTSGGPEYALTNASELGANALALFLKNQRRWESKDIEEASAELFKRLMVEKELGGE